MKTVKQINNTSWEVQLDYGILPEIITISDLFDARFQSCGTMINNNGENMDKYIRRAMCMQAVEEWLESQGKVIGFGIMDKIK